MASKNKNLFCLYKIKIKIYARLENFKFFISMHMILKRILDSQIPPLAYTPLLFFSQKAFLKSSQILKRIFQKEINSHTLYSTALLTTTTS